MGGYSEEKRSEVKNNYCECLRREETGGEVNGISVVKFPGIYYNGNIPGNVPGNIPGNISNLGIFGNKLNV